MKSYRRAGAGAALVAAVIVAATGCASPTGGKKAEERANAITAGAGRASTPRVKIAMVTHEQPGDTFWDLIQKGAQAAAAKDNIQLVYSADPSGPKQATLVQSAIDSNVKGIAVTLATPDAMKGAVQSAIKAGIPVVAFNSGQDQWKSIGALEYFGQDETLAGETAGKRLNSEGAKNVICVIQAQGQVALESRCAGVKKGFTNGTTTNLNVNGTDLPSVRSTITSKLQQDKSVDTIVTLGAPIALAATQSVTDAGSKAKVVTFDTNKALVGAIQNGSVQWAIDQQPFLQGYEAIDSLWLYINNRNVIGGGEAVLTGPSFIDKSNIAAIAEYAKAGTR